jgi:hypothetical protein
MEKVGIFMAIWNIVMPFGICYGLLEYSDAIYLVFYGRSVIYWQFGLFFPVLVYCVKKNLATLVGAVLKRPCAEVPKQKLLMSKWLAE